MGKKKTKEYKQKQKEEQKWLDLLAYCCWDYKITFGQEYVDEYFVNFDIGGITGSRLINSVEDIGKVFKEWLEGEFTEEVKSMGITLEDPEGNPIQL